MYAAARNLRGGVSPRNTRLRGQSIIGINHDDLADGSGKAGLTFLTTSTGIWSPMNAIDTNAGGWEKSELRQLSLIHI